MSKKTGVAYWSKKLIGNGGVLNEYVKWRDAVDNENGKPIAECITCGKRVSGANLHAGHFASRRFKRVAYDEQNLHAQCAYCNKWLNGNPIIYRKRIKELYGKETLARLERAVTQPPKVWKPYELEELYNKYKGLLAELKRV